MTIKIKGTGPDYVQTRHPKGSTTMMLFIAGRDGTKDSKAGMAMTRRNVERLRRRLDDILKCWDT